MVRKKRCALRTETAKNEIDVKTRTCQPRNTEPASNHDNRVFNKKMYIFIFCVTNRNAYEAANPFAGSSDGGRSMSEQKIQQPHCLSAGPRTRSSNMKIIIFLHSFFILSPPHSTHITLCPQQWHSFFLANRPISKKYVPLRKKAVFILFSFILFCNIIQSDDTECDVSTQMRIIFTSSRHQCVFKVLSGLRRNL